MLRLKDSALAACRGRACPVRIGTECVPDRIAPVMIADLLGVHCGSTFEVRRVPWAASLSIGGGRRAAYYAASVHAKFAPTQIVHQDEGERRSFSPRIRRSHAAKTDALSPRSRDSTQIADVATVEGLFQTPGPLAPPEVEFAEVRF